MKKITPFLWFDNNAEEAANFYLSIFKNGKITNIARYPEGGPAPAGSVMTVSFELEGQDFVGLNGGPAYKHSPAVSLFVDCKTQEEIDTLWEKLSAGGRTDQCGWLQDKFGVSWQIAPGVLLDMYQDKDPAVAPRVMQAMMKMTKMDLAALQRARAGK